MAMAGTGLDPNVAGLKKRLYGQVTADAPQAAAAAPVTPSVSPDFAPQTGTAAGFGVGSVPINAKYKTFDGGPDGLPPGGPLSGSPTIVKESATPAFVPAGTPRATTMGAPAGAPTDPTRVTVPTPPAPPVLAPGATAPPAATAPPPPAAAAPSPSGSVEDAVAENYKTLGATPTGPGTGPTDSAYFIRRINETGGMTPDNIKYWFGPDGRIARELRHEVPPEKAASETPGNRALAPPSATKAGAITGTPANLTASGSSHRPGDGVPGVYDFDNAGNPVDAFGRPYTGPLKDGSSAGGGGDFNSQIRDMLMKRLAELGGGVDENSTGISQALSAARNEGTRASEQERTALAEHLYADGGGGLNSNAITQGIQQSAEKQGAAMSGLRANLIMGEYARKQTSLQQTLQLAVQSGDAEAARAAQKAIADLQAQLQREGFGVDLAKYQAYLNQHAVEMGLNG